MDHDDYPSGEPDTVSEACPECNGTGTEENIGCCGNPTRSGSCCGNGIPIQEPCNCCGGKGIIEIPLDEYNDQRRDDEADKLRD